MLVAIAHLDSQTICAIDLYVTVVALNTTHQPYDVPTECYCFVCIILAHVLPRKNTIAEVANSHGIYIKYFGFVFCFVSRYSKCSVHCHHRHCFDDIEHVFVFFFSTKMT